MRQVYKGEIEEKLLSRSLQPLNETYYEHIWKNCQTLFSFLFVKFMQTENINNQYRKHNILNSKSKQNEQF